MMRPLRSLTLFPYTTLFRSEIGQWFGGTPEHDTDTEACGEEHRNPRKCGKLGFISVFAQRDFAVPGKDRKSTRLNSSHVAISYAVFCLKKKNNTYTTTRDTN